MGLSNHSTGRKTSDSLSHRKQNQLSSEYDLIALAGNPNVGKSTLFNGLTGMKQHTGNWIGKTVDTCRGVCRRQDTAFCLMDLPGCYSLFAHSAEEAVARDFIWFSEYRRIVTVCDTGCLERNLPLVLQIIESCGETVIVLNLKDEAEAKGIFVNETLLSERIGMPVVKMSARHGKEVFSLLPILKMPKTPNEGFAIPYPQKIESYLQDAAVILLDCGLPRRLSRFIALRFLDCDAELSEKIGIRHGIPEEKRRELSKLAENKRKKDFGNSRDTAGEYLSEAIAAYSAKLLDGVVTSTEKPGGKQARDRKIDRILMGRYTAFPLMFLLLLAILWLTVYFANIPSRGLSAFFSFAEHRLYDFLAFLRAPGWLRSLLCEGVFRVVGWVISVMLPPMAIFFPLFTLLEDIGLLPRIACNTDRLFKGCGACGKQALTICMGYGCNAAGVVGCRIIDSERERLIAILTNSFAPCNGRFPILIAVIAMFFPGSGGLISALYLSAVIVFGWLVTLLFSRFLSKTFLKGIPSSFTLELPPFRRPHIGEVLIRSVLDRTLFVLARAVAVAAPTGGILWLMTHLSIDGTTILSALSEILSLPGQIMGLDGVILLAFVFGLPANEIVLPIIFMCYTSGTALCEYTSLDTFRTLLCQNGWTALTALNMVIFTTFHWPCSTTLLTIKKETGKLRYAIASALFPTIIGVILCSLTHGIAGIL